MKRSQIIQKLLKEGFSEKTLVNFNDKQLKALSTRILSEQEDGVEHIPQADASAIDNAKKTKKRFVTYEEESDVENDVQVEGVKKWVKKLAKENHNPYTSKKEIMSLIQEKVTNSGANVPEFMTYDAIAAQPERSTETRPVPTKEPGTKQPARENPRRAPFKPKHPEKPIVEPKPKAVRVNESKKQSDPYGIRYKTVKAKR
jgi:hypothetical protein